MAAEVVFHSIQVAVAVAVAVVVVQPTSTPTTHFAFLDSMQ